MNITSVTLLKQVRGDLEDGRLFYNSNEKGIGTYFYDTIISDIESLYLYAGMHSKHWGLYRLLSKRFPFAIYYHIHNKTAIVVAVLDLRRNPAWVRKKIQSRDP